MDVVHERKFHLVVLAAGSGTRAGAGAPKQFALDDQGISLLHHSLARATRSVRWDSITIAVPRARLGTAERTIESLALAGARVVAGGARRIDTLRLSIAAVEGSDQDVCVVHDGVRPFTPPDLFVRVTSALSDQAVDACWPMSSARDTAVFASRSQGPTVIPADEVSIAATPIAIRFGALVRALEADTPLQDILIDRILRTGARWTHVENPWWNLKVTTSADMDAVLHLLNRNAGHDPPTMQGH